MQSECMSGKLYTAREMAEMLQVSQDTVYRYGVSGKLETLRIGGSVRFVLPGKDNANVEDRTSGSDQCER